ncbi:MAG: hypothetical protein AB1633_13635, partial [Elusimicrobiota bacterium]
MNKLVIFFLVIYVRVFIINQNCFADSWEKTRGTYAGKTLSMEIDLDGFIFIGTDQGVYKSIDQGNSWEKIGLDSLCVTRLAFNDSFLFAGTNKGLYYRDSERGKWYKINSSLLETYV